MKVSKKIAINLIGAAGLVMVSAGALAHPGGGYGRAGMGPGFGPCAAAADAGATCPAGGPGAMRGWQGGGCAYGPGVGRGPAAGGPQSLMTDEERQAFRDKMRNAASPEERQKLALENRAEMAKRAAERGIELPPMRGPRMGQGTGPGTGPMRGWTAPEGETR